MLTGQFNELYDSIGSGVPVRIHKLDNNGTVAILKVDHFTKAEEIPYPWSDHPWSDSFIGYSVSRDSLKRAGTITSPIELYCFYDADVTLTFKLPIPGSKAVSIQYGVGQYPQLHDISENGVLLADYDQGISFCLPDGKDIDSMVKPVNDTDVEVRICNKARTININAKTYVGNTIGYCLNAKGQVMTFNVTADTPRVDVTPVSFEVPKIPVVAVTSQTTSFGKQVPAYMDLFSRTYTLSPQVSEITGTGHFYFPYSGHSATTKLVAREQGVVSMGFVFGSVTSSKPTSFPSGTPSLVNETSVSLNGTAYPGYPISEMSMSYGQYIPFRLRAKLADSTNKLSVSLSADSIVMNGLPNGVSSWFSSPRLRDWLEQGSDSSVSEWWSSNYSSIFYTS